MASTEASDLPRKRTFSYELLPPSLAELRVVILGNSWRNRSSVGNLLLDQPAFDPNTEPKHSKCLSGSLQSNKTIFVTNTPDLLQPDLSSHRLTELTEQISEACAPGPHVFLLVLQPEDFTETHKTRLLSVLERVSEQAFDHSLVLISPPREETPGYMEKYMNDPHLQDMIVKCRYRYLWMNMTEHQRNLKRTDLLSRVTSFWKNIPEHDIGLKNFKHKELLTRISQIVKERKGEHLITKPSLNLVLCGRRGAGKTSVVKSILGETDAALSPEQCVKHQGEVCGRWVSVVELPALSGKPLETVMQQCLSCISLCGPEGVHAFILVLPVGPLTDQDKNELDIIQDTFSSEVNNFTMVLFTVDSDRTAPAVVDFGNKDIQELCQSCGGRYLIFDTKNRQQVRELVDNVELLKSKNSPQSYTMETLQQMAGMNIMHMGLFLKTIHIRSGQQSPGCLRIAVIGKTGTGKSSSGNTILGKEAFESKPSQRSVTEVCQKVETNVDGRLIAVVDTPGLFDTNLSHDEERLKCISLLSPGPHVFLLVLQIGRLTEEETKTLKLIRKGFGKDAEKFTIILLTHGDKLEDCKMSAEDYIKDESDDSFKELISNYGNRYHVFNNRDKTNHTQVKELMMKIDALVKENGGDCYTNDMLLQAEMNIKKDIKRIMNDKEAERKMMERKYKTEMEEKKQLKEATDKKLKQMEREKMQLQEQNKQEKDKNKKLEEELSKFRANSGR